GIRRLAFLDKFRRFTRQFTGRRLQSLFEATLLFAKRQPFGGIAALLCGQSGQISRFRWFFGFRWLSARYFRRLVRIENRTGHRVGAVTSVPTFVGRYLQYGRRCL